MRRLRHIAFLLLAVLAVSCGPRRIDKDDMEDIFYLMFLQDQRIKQNRDLRNMADTSQVYAAILKSKGYNTDDYIYSLNYYLAEPEKMEKIMGGVSERLEKEIKVVKAEIDLKKWQDKMLGIYRKKIDTTRQPQPPVRAVDTLKVRFGGDSAYIKKEIDSLKLIPRDSLIFLRDTSQVAVDTVAVRDTL